MEKIKSIVNSIIKILDQDIYKDSEFAKPFQEIIDNNINKLDDLDTLNKIINDIFAILETENYRYTYFTNQILCLL